MGGNSICGKGGFCRRTIHVLKRQNPLALVGLVLILLILTSTFTGNVPTGRTHPPRGRTLSLSSSAGNRSLFDSAKSALRQCIKAFGNAPFVYPVVNTPCIKNL